MDRKERCTSLVFFIAVFSFGPFSYARGDLILKITSDVDRIAVLEALPIQVVLENDGGNDLVYSSMLFQDASSPGSSAGLRIVRPDSSAIFLRDPIHKPPVDGEPLPPQILKVGEQRVMSIVLSCQWGIFEPVFDQAGEYRLTAYYEGEGWRAESNEIRVNVTFPPESEREALNALRASRLRCSLYAPEWVFSSPESLRQGAISSLEELATFTGSWLYASYARLTLGRGYVMLAEAESDPALRPAHLEAAERWLNGVDTVRFVLAREVAAAQSKAASLRRSDPSP
jgi:hypothetical protein